MRTYRPIAQRARIVQLARVLAGAVLLATATLSVQAQASLQASSPSSARALAQYEQVLQHDPNAFDALVGATREAVDLGEFEEDRKVRADLYRRATDYARRAVAARPNTADAHFHLARALGRTAMALGPRDRVKYAIDVRTEALQTLALDPKHAGALHILGVWNAEVLRLNAFERTFARAFLGGAVFSSARWTEAIRYMEESVAIEPNRLVHRLDLARVYRDAGRAADARAQYQAALGCPLADANDPHYRAAADRELKQLRRT